MKRVQTEVMVRGHARQVAVDWFDEPADAADAMSQFGGSLYGGSGWTGGETDTDAARFARTGNPKLVRAAERLIERISFDLDTPGDERQASPCGAYPVVPEFLAGRPDCMRRNVYVPHGPVRVIMDTTSSGAIEAADLHTRGTVLLALVMAIMTEQRPVELHWTCALDIRRQDASAIVVRCPTQPVNLGVCCHLLTSQAWTRSLGYTYLDKVHEARGGWPFDTKPSDETAQAMRTAYGLGTEDVYIPPIFIHDALLDDPVAWINDKLANLRNPQ